MEAKYNLGHHVSKLVTVFSLYVREILTKLGGGIDGSRERHNGGAKGLFLTAFKDHSW